MKEIICRNCGTYFELSDNCQDEIFECKNCKKTIVIEENLKFQKYEKPFWFMLFLILFTFGCVVLSIIGIGMFFVICGLILGILPSVSNQEHLLAIIGYTILVIGSIFIMSFFAYKARMMRVNSNK